jgi:hypothetical protein
VINDTSVCATFQSGSKFICCNFTHGYILYSTVHYNRVYS